MRALLFISLLVGPGCRGRESGEAGAPVLSPIVSTASALPLDLMPMDVERATGTVLCSSYREGLVELTRASGVWQVARRWRPGRELPAGIFGEACYGAAGTIYVVLLNHGVLSLRGERAVRVEAAALHGNHPYRVLARRNGELWVAYPPLPFGPRSGAALQVMRDGVVARTVALDDRELATISRWIELEDEDAVLAATRAGLIAFRGDGSVQRRSVDAVSSLALEPGRSAVGAAGTVVGRLRAGHMEPLLFSVPSTGHRLLGDPIDLAIGRNGRWFVLYDGGLLVEVPSGGGAAARVAAAIPMTASRLLSHRPSGDLLIGTQEEGMAALTPRM